MILLVTDMPLVQTEAAGACLSARTYSASLSMLSLWLCGHKMTSWYIVSCQDGK